MIEIITYKGEAPSHGLDGSVTRMVPADIVQIKVDGSVWIEEPEVAFKMKLMALSKMRKKVPCGTNSSCQA